MEPERYNGYEMHNMEDILHEDGELIRSGNQFENIHPTSPVVSELTIFKDDQEEEILFNELQLEEVAIEETDVKLDETRDIDKIESLHKETKEIIDSLNVPKPDQSRMSTIKISGKSGGSVSKKIKHTYKTEPNNPFDPSEVKEIMKNILESELNEDMVYNEEDSPKLCQLLSIKIRNAVKILRYDGYKILCFVEIFEKTNGKMISGFSYLWDVNLDKYAGYNFSNNFFVCSAFVYGIYYE